MKKRQTNFELLRIVSILLIICFHYVYKSGYEFEEMTINAYIVKVFWLVGEIGVNLFILITGYFTIKTKFSFKKVILIILETWFYNLFSLILNYYLYKYPFSLYHVIFPVIYSKYWFVTAYIIIYILSPFINKLVHSISKRDFQKLLLILLLIWCIIPTIFGIRANSTEAVMHYNRFIWLIVMYLIGAYIRLYDIKLFTSEKKSIFIAGGTFILMMSSILVIYKFKEFFELLGTTEYSYLWRPNNIFSLIVSVSVFEFFAKLKIKTINIVNLFATTTLGVYMLHDGFLSVYLWKYLFQNKVMLDQPLSIIYIIGSATLIFIVSSTIDLIRQKIEKYTVVKLMDLDIWKKIYTKAREKCIKVLDQSF